MASVSAVPPHLSRWGLLGASTSREDVYGWKVVSLESVSTEILIRGFVAQVSAKLVYCNTTGGPLQVKAVFPVDEGAAVYHCEARLDGRTIVTHCMEKSKAEKVYKDAVSAGKTAVMAQEHDDTSDILKLNLGNLPAGSKAELNLRLVMELLVQADGAISFVLPTVLNPRYAPADHQTQEDRWSYMGHPENHIVYASQQYSIDVKAQVIGSHQIARVISHTDSLSVTLADDALSAQVRQEGGFKYDHDWSMLVYYNSVYQPHLLRETGDRAATGIMKDDLLMLNFFPEVPADTYSDRNEIIFVIDRSGSMQGENIQSARTTLLLFLKSLPPGCLFNVVSFGNTFSLLFPEGSQTYTEETLSLACRLHDSMDADMGGTEILRPLQNIYSKAPIPGYSRQILLITDGQVWNVDQVLQLVARHAHETRLFSVGVGHGVSTALVRGAARAGRGRSEMVVQQSLLQQKVMALLRSMVQENVQDVTIVCEVEPTSTVRLVPKVPPVIFGGQHIILYARVPSTTKVKSVTVRGQLGTKPIVNTTEGHHITLVHDEAKSLHRLAARSQIQQWQLDEEEDVAEDMIALSVASGVVCRRTALVGVDQESGNPIPEFESVELTQTLEWGYCSALSPGNQPSPSWGKRTTHSARSRGIQICHKSAPLSTLRTFSCIDDAASRHVAETLALKQQTINLCATREPALKGGFFPALKKLQSLFHFGRQNAGPDKQPPNARTQNAGPDMQPPSGLMGVVSLQQFDGSWKLSDVAQLTGVALDVLSANNPVKTEAAWATALVLVLLEKKFDDQRDQWTLLATKAQNFISRCGEQVEELLAKARLTLDSK